MKKFKRLIILFLALTLCLGGVTAGQSAVFAAGNTGFAEPLIPRFGSNGKFLAPIEAPVSGSIPISTRAELEAIRYDLSAAYHLTADIDLYGEEWTPIGFSDLEGFSFEGIFDGQGHVIRNMRITGNEYDYDYECYGLFGHAYGAIIKNTGMEGTYIDVSSSRLLRGTRYAGGIIGSTAGVAISNCYNMGEVAAATSASTDAEAGGIIGRCYFGYYVSISNCYNTAKITADANAYPAEAGGIAGYIHGYEISISNCYNTGNVSAATSANYSVYAGGLAGGIAGDGYDFSVGNCYNTGDVSASAANAIAYTGGVFGYASAYEGSIGKCYNTGNVYAAAASYTAYAGGIAGYGSGSGYSDDGLSVEYCYNSGNMNANAVDASAEAGGIVGTSVFNIYIGASYNTGDVSAFAVSDAAYAGGIAGYGSGYDLYTGISESINICYNTGKVLAASDDEAYAGGIFGSSYDRGGFYGTFVLTGDCYNTGDVSASAANAAYAGGISGAGVARGSGLPGGSIRNCYNTGNVYVSAPDNYIGGICGDAGGEISNCYLLNDYGSEFGERLTPEQMKNQASFDGWDFNGIWTMIDDINSGYPVFWFTAAANVAPGDINDDGVINMQDILSIYQYSRGKAVLTGDALSAADVNGDGVVNLQDVLLVYQYFRGKLAQLR